MADYSVCIHEGAHAVTATLLGVSWHLVTTNPHDGTLGRMIPDRDVLLPLLQHDPEADWAAAAYGTVCLAGPVAEARWLDAEYSPRIDLDRLEDFGGKADLANARFIAEDAGLSIKELLGHAINFVHHDRCWLAMQRVADALVERRTLITTDVNKLVYGRVRGAQ